MKITFMIGMAFIAGFLAQPPRSMPNPVIITWPLVEQPKLMTYRIYHTTVAPPKPAWTGTFNTNSYTVKFENGATAGYPPPSDAVQYDIGITNRFIPGNVDRTKTNYWAMTFLVDVSRITGGQVYSKIIESDVSNWVKLLPGVESPDELRMVIQ